MRDYNIQTEPVAFLDILELRREEEVNRHGGVVISGHITDEQEEEYMGAADRGRVGSDPCSRTGR